jgi:hypothetical protein
MGTPGDPDLILTPALPCTQDSGSVITHYERLVLTSPHASFYRRASHVEMPPKRASGRRVALVTIVEGGCASDSFNRCAVPVTASLKTKETTDAQRGQVMSR